MISNNFLGLKLLKILILTIYGEAFESLLQHLPNAQWMYTSFGSNQILSKHM